MGHENHEEFGAALAGEHALTDWLTANGLAYREMTGDQVAAGLGDLVDEVDTAFLTGDVADYLARSFRHALSTGLDGWRDDDLAFARPWGVDLAAITVPVVCPGPPAG